MSPRKLRDFPSYCRRRDGGRDYAYVALHDAATGRRKIFRLGPYGSEESHEKYVRLVAGWQASGRRLPGVVGGSGESAGGLTISQLCHGYWASEDVAAHGRGEKTSIALAIRVLRSLAGGEPVATFGPALLRLVRDRMVAGDPTANPPRRPWSRGYINGQIKRLVRVVKWGVAHELVPPDVYAVLRTIEPLRRGRCAAREAEPVRPAPLHLVEATRPFLPPIVLTMVDLALVTGMRPGELCAMRACDVDTSGPIWTYVVQEHKTSYRGRSRIVFLGPRAKKLLKPLMRGRPTSGYLFDPRLGEADRRAARSKARKTPAGQGNGPGTNRVDEPRRSPGEAYTPASYGKAIARACAMAFPPPEELAGDAQALAAWRREHSWTPYQLRHNFATEARRVAGLESAAVLLGHASATITDAVYAERDLAKAAAIAGKIG